MRGAVADQGVEPVPGVEPIADLQQLGAEPLRLGVGGVRRGVGRPDQAEQSEQPPALVVERPELDPTPPPLAAGVDDQGRPRGGRPARASGGG